MNFPRLQFSGCQSVKFYRTAWHKCGGSWGIGPHVQSKVYDFVDNIVKQDEGNHRCYTTWWDHMCTETTNDYCAVSPSSGARMRHRARYSPAACLRSSPKNNETSAARVKRPSQLHWRMYIYLHCIRLVFKQTNVTTILMPRKHSWTHVRRGIEVRQGAILKKDKYKMVLHVLVEWSHHKTNLQAAVAWQLKAVAE